MAKYGPPTAPDHWSEVYHMIPLHEGHCQEPRMHSKQGFISSENSYGSVDLYLKPC